MRVVCEFLLLCTLVVGCSTPFSASINDYDFSHEQAPAAVVFSDPQVYSRETLVNDRRLEAAYLRTLLDDSRTINFAPQLCRDLQTLTGFVAQMNLLYDPSAGSAFARNQAHLDEQREIDRLNAQAALVRAQAALLQEQRRLEALQRGEAPADTTPQSGTTSDQSGAPPNGSTPSLPAAPAATDTAAVNALTLGDIRSLLNATDRVRDLLSQVSNANPIRAADVPASPQELFHDRQTYREEIRAALADANLDDGHDLEGNALYRLQFRATVMPGDHRGQFAIARITFAPPALTNREIAELYMSWLAYVNRELNETTIADRPDDTGGSATSQFTDASFRSEIELIGSLSGLFQIVDVYPDAGSHRPTSIAAPPPAAAYLRRAICEAGTGLTQDAGCSDEPVQDPNALKQQAIAAVGASTSQTPMQADPAMRCATPDLLAKVDAFLGWERRPALALSMLVAGAEGGLAFPSTRANQRSVSLLVQHIRDDLVRRQQTGFLLAQQIAEAIEAAQFDDQCRNGDVLADDTASLRNPALSQDPAATLGGTLQTFRSLIQDPRDLAREAHARPHPKEEGPFRPIPRGDMAAFFARPIDQAQRVSSIQGAANAIDLALALRAQTGGSGVSGAAGANFVHQAIGRIETQERAPIVVGFNDRDLVGDCEDRSRLVFSSDCGSHGAPRALPQSGWVLGPPIAPAAGGTRLEARQALVNQSVSTDISAPGWWPRIQARLETAWVHDWGQNAEGRVFRDRGDRSVRVFNIELPHSSDDMRSLTRLLSGLGSPLTRPQITAVTPTNLQVCPDASSLRIQVAGRDLWQGAEAYLNGVAATEVRILPDMGGLDLVFPTANLPLQTGAAEAQNANLVIWTRDSQTNYWINVRRADATTPFCVQEHADSHAGNAAALSLSQTWLAPGVDFHAELADHSALASRSEVRVQIRHFNSSAGGAGVAWTALATESGSQGAPLSVSDNGVLGFTMPSSPLSGYDDGSLVEMSVAIRPRSGGAETQIAAPPRLAYFTAADQTAIDSGAITITAGDAPMRMIAELPRRQELRFEGLPAGDTPPDSSKMAITGALAQGGQTFQFASAGPWTFVGRSAAGRPRYATNVRFQGSPTDVQTFWTALNSSGANGLTGQFTLTINGRRVGPTVAILIKKQ